MIRYAYAAATALLAIAAPAASALVSEEVIYPRSFDGPPWPGYGYRQFVTYTVDRGSGFGPGVLATDRFDYIIEFTTDDPIPTFTTRSSMGAWLYTENGPDAIVSRYYGFGGGSPVPIERGFRVHLPFVSGTYTIRGQEFYYEAIGQFQVTGEIWENTNTTLRILRYETGTAPVPEPNTWALMLIGFGVIGMIARRHSAAELAAEA